MMTGVKLSISIAIITIFLLASKIKSQNLIDFEFKGSVSKFLLEVSYDLEVENGVQFYKILYTTQDVEGALDTASGLLVIPDVTDGEYPSLIVHHGTVGSREEVPSNLDGGYELAIIFAANGYFTCAPDYLGLGESRGFHPYVHAKTEASASIDMLFAAQEYARSHDISLNEQLFITGYSQGGHAAMAAHRAIERDYSEMLTVTASAPMSGPYDISGKTVQATLGDEPYSFVAYLAYTSLSYLTVYKDLLKGLTISGIFKPQYAELIERFKNEEIDLWVLNQQLIDKLNEDIGESLSKYMLNDSIYQAIFNDPDYPLNLALQDNDVYDWTPQAPTRLMYCTADDQVNYKNSICADSIMNANGAVDLASIDINPNLTHGQCALPATFETLSFFNSFKDMTTLVETASNDYTEHFKTFPNPASNHLSMIINPDLDFTSILVRITDLSGKIVQVNNLAPLQNNYTISISNIPNGIYYISVISSKGVSTQKFLVQR